MLIYLTADGLARAAGDVLLLLDLSHQDIGEVFADTDDRDAAYALLRDATVAKRIPVGEAELRAPVTPPGRFVLVGANYADHVREAGMPMPESPVFVMVPDQGLCGPSDIIRLPVEAPTMVDYEGELAVVLAGGGRDISAERAWSQIGGFTVVNDVSARDVQLSAMLDGVITDGSAVARAKSFPSFKPLGPAVLVPEQITDQPDLRLQTRVNGEIRQEGRTGDMIFDLAQIIAYVSRTEELRPGDVVLTGTPSGVALTTGAYLRHGDNVEVEIERIGTLTNPVCE